MLKKQEQLKRRQRKIRAKIQGREDRPRLHVFRSNNHIYASLIDDQKGTTLMSLSDKDIKKGKKTEKAAIVGEELAKKAVEQKIGEIVFDRGGYKYHGRVKALAEGARKGGLKF